MCGTVPGGKKGLAVGSNVLPIVVLQAGKRHVGQMGASVLGIPDGPPNRLGCRSSFPLELPDRELLNDETDRTDDDRNGKQGEGGIHQCSHLDLAGLGKAGRQP